jgi:ankyrin
MRQSHRFWKNEDIHGVEAIRGECTRSATGATRQPKLCQAAGLGNLSVVQYLIDMGENVSAKANDGSTPLHCASRAGHVDVLVLLIEMGSELSEKNHMERTALQEAALGNHVEAVRALVNRGADTLSILHTVIKVGTKELFELLIEYLGLERILHTQIQTRNRGILSPLHLAALYGNEQILRALLSDPKVDPKQKSNAGWAPLHYAALLGHDGVVNILLETKQVDVNSVGRGGQKPLHCAIERRYERIVKRLLACEDLDVNATDHVRLRRIPVHLAIESGNVPILKLLVQDHRFDRGCPNPTCLDGIKESSLLQIAAHLGRLEIVEWLLSTQDIYKSPNTVNEYLLLHHAVYESKGDMVKLLLERKDVDIETRAGHNHFFDGWRNKTALQIARAYGRKDMADILLAHGAIEHPTESLALPAVIETNATSAVPLSEVLEMGIESSQDLDMDEDTTLDFEMQDSFMEEF